MYHSDISEFTHYSELNFDAVRNSSTRPSGPRRREGEEDGGLGRDGDLGERGGWLVPYADGSTSEMDE
jgi:hypothetical protein